MERARQGVVLSQRHTQRDLRHLHIVCNISLTHFTDQCLLDLVTAFYSNDKFLFENLFRAIHEGRPQNFANFRPPCARRVRPFTVVKNQLIHFCMCM